MKAHTSSVAALIVLSVIALTGCGSDSSPTGPGRVYNVWQNPFMSPNPTNNIHSDSYLTDSYPYAGPVGTQAVVSQAEVSIIKDPLTGESRVVVLGECASQAFDAQGNIQTLCAGLPSSPDATSMERSVVTIDRNTLQILAFYPFSKTFEKGGKVDFGGAGYFYQDNQYRMVVAMPDGHVLILRRAPSNAGGIDGYAVDADYNVTGTGGAIPIPSGFTSINLYALVPDKAGNIWFTTAEGIVGTITPSKNIKWLNLNDPNNTGHPEPQSDGGLQTIANSHAVDEGDSDGGPSGAYILTTYHLYRLGAAQDGTPHIDWSAAYDHGTGPDPKSGQTSVGSGTSPTVFRIGNRRFVTIADNAKFMNVNVYRAETNLLAGENRLFAQVTPFGQDSEVSDENSLIVAAGVDGNSMDIYAENNFGNDDVTSTFGPKTTKPGFARMHLQSDGTFTVASVNNTIAVPSLVSKVSLASNIVYTYNKTPDGWFLTGLDADDLNKVRFTTRIGPGSFGFNNFYAGLALDADGKTVWVGTLFGLTKIRLQ